MARSEDKNKPRSFFRRDLFEGSVRVLTGFLLIGGTHQILFDQTPVAAAQATPQNPAEVAQGFKTAEDAAGVNPDTLSAFPFQPEFASSKRDLVIANFGLNHGIKVEDTDRDRLDLAIATLKDLRIQQGKVWKPVYVETHDDFRDLPDFVPSQRLSTPEFQFQYNPDLPAKDVGLKTFAFQDLTDRGDSLRIRVCFNPGYTDEILNSQLFEGDNFIDWRRFRAAQNLSAFIADVLNFNDANTMWWPSYTDESGVDRLKLDPAAIGLFNPNPFAQVI